MLEVKCGKATVFEEERCEAQNSQKFHINMKSESLTSFDIWVKDLAPEKKEEFMRFMAASLSVLTSDLKGNGFIK